MPAVRAADREEAPVHRHVVRTIVKTKGTRQMDDDKLDRCLQSVGKCCFVNYFDDFGGGLSSDSVVGLLVKNEGYAEKATQARVSTARSIIEAGRAEDALRVISGASRVPESVRVRATKIAEGLR